MPEQFHHPQVDRLREAAQNGPPLAPSKLGARYQGRLHARIVQAIHDDQVDSPRRWGPGASPEDDHDK
jgi:hypothetical protein